MSWKCKNKVLYCIALHRQSNEPISVRRTHVFFAYCGKCVLVSYDWF